MKKSYVAIGMLSLFVPVVVLAATYMSDKNVETGQTIEGNLYLAGGNPTIAGTVNGDAMVAGGNLAITGKVMSDATLAGGNTSITGDIGGDLRAMGGTLNVNSKVGGEAILFGGEVKIGPLAVINGDLVVNGGTVTVDPAAQIKGNKIINNGQEVAEKMDKEARANTWSYYFAPEIYYILSLILVTLIFGFVYKNKLAERMINAGIQKGSFWRNLGIGFAVLVLTPIACLILFITGIGVFLGFILLFAYICMLLMCTVLAGMIFGGWVQRMFEKNDYVDFHWGWILGGVVVSHLLTLIPLVGWIFGLIFFLLAIGALISQKWDIAKHNLLS